MFTKFAMNKAVLCRISVLFLSPNNNFSKLNVSSPKVTNKLYIKENENILLNFLCQFLSYIVWGKNSINTTHGRSVIVSFIKYKKSYLA